ncbi:HAD-like protein [Fistulina hepatica ATCC 64428]|nr:HAD-like protein [Fistulina hepatica ATCC 64428]
MSAPPICEVKAVIFDIGGVVTRSPFIAIAAYEKRLGLPPNYLNCLIVERGSEGAWQRFERGEVGLFDFYDAFSKDLSDTSNGNRWYKMYAQRKGIEYPRLPEKLSVNGRELFAAIMRDAQTFDTHVMTAIRRLRAAGRHKIIALTNNFGGIDQVSIPQDELRYLGWENGVIPSTLCDLFDDFCDSSMLGMRKPEPGIYLLCCERNGIAPQEAVLLDDLGINLKTARDLGMQTIHVRIGRTLDAVCELEAKVGIDLHTPYGTTKAAM